VTSSNIRDTPNGYNPYEVASALQKCIRRGREYEAYWWAHELLINQQGTWLWRRLLTIACEDVGMADPQAIVVVNACHQAWLELSESRGDPELSILAEAVIYLCRSKKSRTADDLAHLVYIRKEGRDPKTLEKSGAKKEHLEIPAFALDIHTRRGKIRIDKTLGPGEDPDAAGVRLFREEGARLDKPIRDIANDGTNWTEEVCKLQAGDVSLALKPTEEIDE